jgi:hypothetical protein
VEVPSLASLKSITTAYLRGDIAAEDLVASRIAWYREKGCQHPHPAAAISVFKEIEARIPIVLMTQQSHVLSAVETVLQNILRKGCIDTSADIFALSVFCAFRKLALNEVYLEVLDRNPRPNHHSDQQACFAEMFALGAQCDAYLDMTPNAAGKILAEWTSAYYKLNKPPP